MSVVSVVITRVPSSAANVGWTTTSERKSAMASTARPAPVAVDDVYSVKEGGMIDTVLARLPDVLANDKHVEGNLLIALLVSDVSNGTLTLDPNGSFVYTHDRSQTTIDKFSYRANDGKRDSNVAIVSITINPVNDPTTTSTATSVSVPPQTPPPVPQPKFPPTPKSTATLLGGPTATPTPPPGPTPTLTPTPAPTYTPAATSTPLSTDPTLPPPPARPIPTPTPAPTPTSTPTPTPTATLVPREAKLGLEIEKVDNVYKKFGQYEIHINATITESGGVDVELTNVRLCYETSFHAPTENCDMELDDLVIKGNGEHPIDLKLETTDQVERTTLRYSRISAKGEKITEEFVINVTGTGEAEGDDTEGGDGDQGTQ